MPLTRSVALAGTSKEITLLETVPLLISSVKKLQAQVLKLRRAANKKQKLDHHICLDTNDNDIKNILLREIEIHVDDDKPGPVCIGGDQQTACNQENTVQLPNDPLIEVAPMLPLPPLPMNTTLLPPPVPPTTILPVTSVLSSLLRPSIELPSHRIMVFVNGDLDILPLTFNMCRADTFLKLLCRISTICAEDYGSLETGSPCYFFEHNGLQVSTKDTPITLGYGAVAPRYNVEAQYVCLTFRITVLHA